MEKLQIPRSLDGERCLGCRYLEGIVFVATIQQPPAPPIEQPNLPASITLSTVITLGVGSFFAKWMFGQITSYWKEQILDIKKDLHGLQSDISSLSSRDEDIRSEIGKLKYDIAQEYVSREDWIRANVGLENKIDRLGLRIEEKFDRLLEKLGRG